MATATIPVDLRNPGQVFACLGFMEAAEVLIGPAEGGFAWEGSETQVAFTLSTEGSDDPVRTALAFLARAEVKALAPSGSSLADSDRGVATVQQADLTYPCPEPNTPSALPAILVGQGNSRAGIAIEYWVDGRHIGRDNVKFWGGSGGYSGAARGRDALSIISRLSADALEEAAAAPFSVAAPQSSSFRFDWRRDNVPLDIGFALNTHSAMAAVGYPIVELLAAIGLQNSRPDRPDPRDKLTYRYAVWNAMLPTPLARAVLGAERLHFPLRVFRMRLGWPAKENQERCIIDAQEESVP